MIRPDEPSADYSNALLQVRRKNARAVVLVFCVLSWLVLPGVYASLGQGRSDLLLTCMWLTAVASSVALALVLRGSYSLPVFLSIGATVVQHTVMSTIPTASLVTPFFSSVYLLMGSVCLSVGWLPALLGLGVGAVATQWWIAQQFAPTVSVFQGPHFAASVLLVFTSAVVCIGVRSFEQAMSRAQQEFQCHQVLLLSVEKGARMQALGRLAAGIAHDFNNYLFAISTSTELADSQPEVPQRVRAELLRIQKTIDRASALTEQLLTFSRPQGLKHTDIDLSQVLRDLLPLLERVVGQAVRVTLSAPLQLAAFRANRGQIEQVILNLATNARDALPEGGELKLTASHIEIAEHQVRDLSPGSYLLLEVADTGVGIAPELMQFLFDPFFTTKSPGDGTGLGLSTCFGLIQQLHGAIVVDSQQGQGTQFRVYFPQSPTSP